MGVGTLVGKHSLPIDWLTQTSALFLKTGEMEFVFID